MDCERRVVVVVAANLSGITIQAALTILTEYYRSLSVNLVLFSQNGLAVPSQCLPASSFLQQADGEHLCYSEVEETGDDQEDDGGGK